MSNKIVDFSMRTVSTAIENFIIDDWAATLNSLFATDLGDVQSKGFWWTKENSALHHFQSFPTLFDIRKIPSSLPNGEISTFSGLRLLSSLSKPAALTAADFTSFHISLFVDPLVSLLWNNEINGSFCHRSFFFSLCLLSLQRTGHCVIMGCFGA